MGEHLGPIELGGPPSCRAFRRGQGTIMKQLTGTSTAGRDLLDHTDDVTQEQYEAFLLQSVVAPLRMLEAKVTAEK